MRCCQKLTMKAHRAEVARDHRGRWREVIGVDWTQAHHERGPRIYGVKEAYDYVNRCPSLFQTAVTAVVAIRDLVDGLAVEVQQPDFAEAEMEYLERVINFSPLFSRDYSSSRSTFV